VLHVDHIKPRSKYPELSLTFSNLQILCEDCNFGKSNIDQTDWRPEEGVEEVIILKEELECDNEQEEHDWKLLETSQL